MAVTPKPKALIGYFSVADTMFESADCGYLALFAQETAVDEEANTSTVKVTLELRGAAAASDWAYKSGGGLSSATYRAVKAKVTVDRSSYDVSFTLPTGNPSRTWSVKWSKTVTAKHDAQGAKSLVVKGTATVYRHKFAVTGIEKYTEAFGSSLFSKGGFGEANGENYVLATIPRQCKPSTDYAANFGDTLQIKMDVPSTALSYDLAAVFCGDRRTVATGSNAKSQTLAVPLDDWLRLIPKARTGTMTLECSSRSGATSTGKTTFSVSLSIPEGYGLPTVTGLSVADASGLKDRFGALVQGESAPNVLASVECTAGATVTGVTYEGAVPGEGYSYDTATNDGTAAAPMQPPPRPEGVSFRATVTDSRGLKSTSEWYQAEVIAYKRPSCAVTADRCNAEGAFDMYGEHMFVQGSASFSPLGGANTRRLVVTVDGVSSEAVPLTDWSQAFRKTYGADADTAYKGTVTLTDAICSVEYAFAVNTTFSLMDFHSGGKGIGFGCAAPEEGMEMALPLHCSKSAAYDGDVTYKGKAKFESDVSFKSLDLTFGEFTAWGFHAKAAETPKATYGLDVTRDGLSLYDPDADYDSTPSNFDRLFPGVDFKEIRAGAEYGTVLGGVRPGIQAATGKRYVELFNNYRYGKGVRVYDDGTIELIGNTSASGKLSVSGDARFEADVYMKPSAKTYLTIASGFRAHYGGSNNSPFVRKSGNVVELWGVLGSTTKATWGTTVTTMARGIPAGMRPSSVINELMQGSGTMKWLLTVGTDGTVGVSRCIAANGSSYAAHDPECWFPFHCTWIVD